MDKHGSSPPVRLKLQILRRFLFVCVGLFKRTEQKWTFIPFKSRHRSLPEVRLTLDDLLSSLLVVNNLLSCMVYRVMWKLTRRYLKTKTLKWHRREKHFQHKRTWNPPRKCACRLAGLVFVLMCV